MVNIHNISYTYRRGSQNILEQISFDIADGQCIGILGNNGTGKSTLLKCIDCICPVKGASVLVDGKNVFKMSGNQMAQNIAYVTQNADASDMTVFDTVLLGRKPYIKWDATKEDYRIVNRTLSDMGLETLAARPVSELSGGEAQKVMLARALAQEPKFLLLDEPTSSLDPRNQHEVLKIVKRIARDRNISVILVIHDLNLALRYCDKFLFLKDSRIFSYGGMDTVTEKTIEEVYGLQVELIDHRGTKVMIPC